MDLNPKIGSNCFSEERTCLSFGLAFVALSFTCIHIEPMKTYRFRCKKPFCTGLAGRKGLPPQRKSQKKRDPKFMPFNKFYWRGQLLESSKWLCPDKVFAIFPFFLNSSVNTKERAQETGRLPVTSCILPYPQDSSPNPLRRYSLNSECGVLRLLRTYSS